MTCPKNHKCRRAFVLFPQMSMSNISPTMFSQIVVPQMTFSHHSVLIILQDHKVSGRTTINITDGTLYSCTKPYWPRCITLHVQVIDTKFLSSYINNDICLLTNLKSMHVHGGHFEILDPTRKTWTNHQLTILECYILIDSQECFW